MIWLILMLLLGTPLWFILGWHALDVVERTARDYRISKENGNEVSEWDRELEEAGRRVGR